MDESPAPGWRGLSGRWTLGLLVLAGTLVDAVASVARYDHLQSGLDLAIFDQAIWRYSHLHAAYSSIKGEDLLGDHFHPLIAVLAAFYWVWSDPRMLVIAQGLVLSASIVPVVWFAERRLGRPAALLIGVAYAGFWGVQVGALYDFHELSFAPVLIASAVLAADRERWRWMWSALALLLLVKEDMSLLVACFGLYLVTLGRWRQGLAGIALGLGFYELATHVLIPHFASNGHYGYWSYGELGSGPASAAGALITHPWRLVTVGFSPSQKARTIAALFGPFLLLSLGSRLVLLTLPLLAERFLSTNPSYWSLHFQYSLPIAPILALSAAAGLANLAAVVPERHRRAAVLALCGVIAVGNLAFTRVATSDSALTAVTSGRAWTAPAGAGAGLRALAAVPGGASVASTDTLLGHLSERPTVDRLSPATLAQVSYVVADVLDVGCCERQATDSADGQTLDAALAGFTPVFYSGGWLVARRPADGRPAASGVLAPMSSGRAARLDAAIGSWRNALFGLIDGAGACAGGGGCSAPGAFTAAGRRLAATLALLRAGLSGGCAQIDAAAASAAAGVASGLAPVESAVRRGDRATVARAYVQFRAAEARRDRIGVIARFAILCTPRG